MASLKTILLTDAQIGLSGIADKVTCPRPGCGHKIRLKFVDMGWEKQSPPPQGQHQQGQQPMQYEKDIRLVIQTCNRTQNSKKCNARFERPSWWDGAVIDYSTLHQKLRRRGLIEPSRSRMRGGGGASSRKDSPDSHSSDGDECNSQATSGGTGTVADFPVATVSEPFINFGFGPFAVPLQVPPSPSLSPQFGQGHGTSNSPVPMYPTNGFTPRFFLNDQGQAQGQNQAQGHGRFKSVSPYPPQFPPFPPHLRTSTSDPDISTSPVPPRTHAPLTRLRTRSYSGELASLLALRHDTNTADVDVHHLGPDSHGPRRVHRAITDGVLWGPPLRGTSMSMSMRIIGGPIGGSPMGGYDGAVWPQSVGVGPGVYQGYHLDPTMLRLREGPFQHYQSIAAGSEHEHEHEQGADQIARAESQSPFLGYAGGGEGDAKTEFLMSDLQWSGVVGVDVDVDGGGDELAGW